MDYGFTHDDTVYTPNRTVGIAPAESPDRNAAIYRHNFGGRFISLTVRGTNGARYSGRASYDWGQCVRLRRAK